MQAATRSARELGAGDIPEADLHLQYAEEQTHRARQLVQEGESARATAVLMRARADAELAVALAHEQRAKEEMNQAAKAAADANRGVQP